MLVLAGDLWQASKDGNLQKVREAISCGGDVNRVNR